MSDGNIHSSPFVYIPGAEKPRERRTCMKRVFLLALCLALCLTAASLAEENLFETLAGLEWSFSSGAGAWSTELQLQADGSFTGNYHDSEMGDYADAYPNGTVYFSSFSGRMSLVEQVDGNTWKIRVEKLVRDPGEETVDDGIRFVPTEVYGLSEGDEMLLYSPGTPVSILSEEMQMWAHIMFRETPPTELEVWFLSSEKNDSGFIGYPAASVVNPWEEMTAEQLAAVSGLSFGVPEGAEDVVYRYLASAGLAEMQFSWAGGEYCARIQPAAPEGDSLADISGMYYEWTHEEPVRIGPCSGSLAQAQQEDGTWVERCLWYDADTGRTYSLSVTAADIDGLDLTALAEQVYGQAAQP